jgi:hypothetical protein
MGAVEDLYRKLIRILFRVFCERSNSTGMGAVEDLYRKLIRILFRVFCERSNSTGK